MEQNNITIEQYIEHEVKLRVMKEVNDKRFLEIDNKFLQVEEKILRLEEKIDSKFLQIVCLIITSIALNIALHSLKLL